MLYRMKLLQYFIILFFSIGINCYLEGEICDVRSLPGTAGPGETVEVNINVNITPFSKLLYVSTDNNIWLRTYSGEHIQKTETGNADTPVFDSSSEYFTYSESGIWVSEVDGTFKLKIDDDPDAKYPVFSPSENFLIYVKGGDIYFLYLKTGLNNSQNNNYSYLTDTSASWKDNALVGMEIYNITDGSHGTITGNKSNTVNAALSGGEENDWDGNDKYVIVGTPHKLTDLSSVEGDISFSPDETKILYTGKVGENFQIFYIPVAISESGTDIILNGAPVQLTSLSDNYEPHYSTGGDKIIFISTRNGKRELFLMNEDGTSQNKIILNPEPNEPAYPIFSNYNKNKIIFLSKGNGKIYQAMLDTLESEEILSEITSYKKYDLLQHGTTGMIVYETVPDGWTVTDASLSPEVPFFYKENNYPTYKWIVYISGNLIELPSFTITYKIHIPQNANGLYEFSGSLSTGEEIEGNIDIEVSGFQKGDINRNGEVDITDVILCLRQAVGLDPLQPDLADINENGEVDISDVILILRIAVGLD